ncbi:unnamed protein product, partial [Meganyctiphanes norvegica]
NNNTSRGSDRRKTRSINLDDVDISKLNKLESDSPTVLSTLSSSISDETPESHSRSKNNSESSNRSSILRSSSRQSNKSSSRPSSADISSMSNISSSKCNEIQENNCVDDSIQNNVVCDNENDSVDSEDMVTVVPLKSHKINQSPENISSIKEGNINQSQVKNENVENKISGSGHSKHHRHSHRPRHRSVSLQTHVIKSTSKQSQTDKNKENLSEEQLLENYRKELSAQEERYQKQVDGLTIKLTAKQEEVSNLQ